MTDADDEFAPPPPRRRFRRLRSALQAFVVVLGLLALVVFLARFQVGRVGQRDLDAATRRLDADEPGWRLDSILAERKANEPPPARDAAAVVLEVADALPKDWHDRQKPLFATDDWGRQHPDNRRLSDAALAEAGKLADATRVLRARALALRDRPRGAFPLTIGPDPIATTLPHLDSARRVLSLLELDAYWETLHGNPNRGVSAARAALGAARAVGDEPLLISQLVRMACADMSAKVAMQVLGWGEPTEGLAELQAELLAEADVPWFRVGMRGERAALDRVFQGVADGTIPPENVFAYAEVRNLGPQHFAALRLYKAMLQGDRAKCLQLCTRYVEVSKLPPHEQLPALNEVTDELIALRDVRYVLTRLLLPACGTFAQTALRVRADLLAAGTCVACERFRRQHGRFPNDLAELVPALLPAVPLSPFDGTPFRYRVHPDRVAVTCFWPDAPHRHQNQPDDLADGGRPGTGYGYRLWRPEHRGLPPEPPAEKKDP